MKASESLTREVEPGGYVIVYAGVAIEMVSRAEAEEQLKFLADLEAQFPDTDFPEAST
jgi:hydrogenase maturation factor